MAGVNGEDLQILLAASSGRQGVSWEAQGEDLLEVEDFREECRRGVFQEALGDPSDVFEGNWAGPLVSLA